MNKRHKALYASVWLAAGLGLALPAAAAPGPDGRNGPVRQAGQSHASNRQDGRQQGNRADQGRNNRPSPQQQRPAQHSPRPGAYTQRSWHGDTHRQFDARDLPRWRGGNWRQATHNGRSGWWWVIGSSWYFYTAPVYPYPDPYVPAAVIAQPASVVTASSPSWYYCAASGSYYPYVSTCVSGWQAVPATP